MTDDRQIARLDLARERLAQSRQMHAEATLELSDALRELDTAAAALAERLRIATAVGEYQAAAPDPQMRLEGDAR